MKKPILQYVTISTPGQLAAAVAPGGLFGPRDMNGAYRFFGLTPPQLEADFSNLEKRALTHCYGVSRHQGPPQQIKKTKAERKQYDHDRAARCRGGKSVLIDEIVKDCKQPVVAVSHALRPYQLQAIQMIGRSQRRAPADTRSKAQRKLDKLDYELKRIKANFDLEAGYAYSLFLAKVADNAELRQSLSGSFLHELGYSPLVLGLPMSEQK